ncbi:hypothetical protein BGZ68_007059 [Mortierella alpina]|nr:hypothetical protein BGZ68_007059 [Mortierella alpina]
MDSFLELAAHFNLTSSYSESAPAATQQPASMNAAQRILDIEKIQAQLAEIQSNMRIIQKNQLSDGIRSHSAEARIHCLVDFADQVALLQQHRQQLLAKLDRPRTAEHIIMEQQYHKDIVSVFEQIQEELPRIEQTLNDVEWKNGFLESTSHIDQLRASLEELTELSRKQENIATVTHKLHSNLTKVLHSTA